MSMVAQIDSTEAGTTIWPVAIVVFVVIGVLMFGAGVLVQRVAKRTASGELGRNGWAGIRTKATMSSDEAWLTAHQAGLARTVIGGRILAASGAVAAVLGVVFAAGSPGRAMAVWGVAINVLALGAVVPIVQAAVAGNRAAKAVRDGRR